MDLNVTNSTVKVGMAELVIGSLYIVVSMVEFGFYLPCLIIMRTDRELRSLSCFRLMFHLGLADMCNLFIQAGAGILIMTGSGYHIPYRLNQFYGAVHNSYSWFWYIALCHVIALNRCVTLCMPTTTAQKLFSLWATTLWQLLAFGFATVWFVAQLTPSLCFHLIPDLYTFYFDHALPWYKTAKSAAYWCENLILNLSALWYIIIAANMYKHRKTISNATVASAALRKERRVYYQAGLICFYTMVWNQYWHQAHAIYETHGFKYAYAVGNMLWISNSAVNPFVYLSLNKTIKRKVMEMLSGRRNMRGHRRRGTPTTGRSETVDEIKMSTV